MRSVTAATAAALGATEGLFSLPIFIEISHASLTTPLRAVNNEVDLVYGGDTYTACGFRFDPPEQNEDGSVSNAKLTISSISREFMEALRSLNSRPTITTKAIYWPTTGTTEAVAEWEFLLERATGNAQYITGELIFENRLQNRIPAHVIRPSTCPGAYAG